MTGLRRASNSVFPASAECLARALGAFTIVIADQLSAKYLTSSIPEKYWSRGIIMARKKMVPGLPPLPTRRRFKAKEHKGAQLLELLRGIAIASQREEPQGFYPLREVARHFTVPLSTVSRVYGELEEEGILASVRGSKTLLQGLSSGRHLSVLGFVGMPALTSSFVTLQDCRTFFIRTRRELRSRGFAVATVFYDRSEGHTGRLFSRIDKYDFDTVSRSGGERNRAATQGSRCPGRRRK